ncbi:MAG: DUF6838 family protein [Streptococcus sp.]|uniref:phage tail terminator family protein n=1 Tax=Streptococcus sp. TaxID=1306 RepID=UPI0039923A9F
MINSIIEAISVALNEEFGDGYKIHMEEIRQGLKEPCFFIQCLNPTHELFLGKRYFRTNQFCIQYFPATREKQKECNGVAERMSWRLEYITIYGEDKPTRGTKMKYEVVDGVLNFFVNYDCFVYRREEQTAMEILETSTNVKEGG